MAEELFPLPKSSYEQLTRIIKGYGQQTTDVTPADVAQITGVHPSDVSRNNAFLVAIGVLTKGQRKSLTEPGRSLARALEHEMPDEIRTHWTNLVVPSEFFQKILAAVRIRKSMEIAALRSHIAYVAGQPKKADVLTGAAAVVDVMKAAGVLRDIDGRLTAISSEELGESSPSAFQPMSTATSDVATLKSLHLYDSTSGEMSISVQIQIAVRPNELGQLGSQLRRLIDDLQGHEPETQG